MKTNPMLKLSIQSILYWIIVVAFFNLFTSCAVSKNKQKEKEEIKVEVKSDIKEETKYESTNETKTENQVKSENTSSENSVTYEGEKGDSLTVIEENLTTGEKKKTTFIGSGKFQRGNKTSEQKKSGVHLESKKDKTNTTNKKEYQHSASFNSNSKKVVVHKKTTFSWWWLLLLLIPFFYLNKRFKWIIKLTNYVTKFTRK
ncbi:hypothetical protein GFJ99_11725 [Flavobacterium sp. LMO6]|uniref:Lipoprotein n=1 Tax=Flavobacterium phage vB_FspS_laban6-1 TaxID=2686250 RepID=A0A6B9LB00_9CAUD|nr:hypothetical protein [Flavobacterium sp. LMO6]YP_009854837.1 hypothetical protein HWC90_gp39 [Flavobacterium phage vB_FspS_laban6-1]MQP63364.1 hypothetical protein [Flavobacterium sp. LMO6]QHB39010.1 hypothetical protein laban61_gp039 [Flavobacterium phage vB_FspS_laban6-1]